MHTIDFAKEAMEYMEIKANNDIEGLNDDLSEIDEAINEKSSILSSKKQRIINLHKGYHYILTHHTIKKESLKNLYAILSRNLLDDYSVRNMGEHYRQKPVYILKGGRLDIEPYRGIVIEEGKTSKGVTPEIPNYILKLNDEVIEDNPHQKKLIR